MESTKYNHFTIYTSLYSEFCLNCKWLDTFLFVTFDYRALNDGGKRNY